MLLNNFLHRWEIGNYAWSFTRLRGHKINREMQALCEEYRS